MRFSNTIIHNSSPLLIFYTKDYITKEVFRITMDRIHHDVNIHVSYCVPCGGKTAFDEMTSAIQQHVPTAKVTGEEDHRSGAFEVNINGKAVHSRLQTLAYPDVEKTVQVIQCVSHGGPVPNALVQKPITDCLIS